jgi:hypothetical protein
MSLVITFKIHKMSFIATCFSLKRPSPGNYQLEEIITLHGLACQYYHGVTAHHHNRECILTLPHAIFMYGVHTVFLVQSIVQFSHRVWGAHKTSQAD